jgi:hypothetical protein
MPLVYADSSVLFAHFHPRDEFSKVVDAAVQKDSPDFVYWAFLRWTCDTVQAGLARSASLKTRLFGLKR